MNRVQTSTMRAAVIALTATFTVLSGAAPAIAGCLKEYGDCGDCAERKMVEAILDLSPSDAMDAYVDAIDCDIDLMHCLLYDSHHSYECGP